MLLLKHTHQLKTLLFYLEFVWLLYIVPSVEISQGMFSS